jgi:hypothetical protein
VTVSDASLRLAVRNVSEWGDTDVLPYPLENHWFHDAPDSVVSVLKDSTSTGNNGSQSIPSSPNEYCRESGTLAFEPPPK